MSDKPRAHSPSRAMREIEESEPTADLAADVEYLREMLYICPVHRIADCSPLLNGCSRVNRYFTALDALVARVDTLTQERDRALVNEAVYYEQMQAAEAALADATAIIRRFHEACWTYDGDLPNEIEAAAGDALTFLGDTFRPSAGDKP